MKQKIEGGKVTTGSLGELYGIPIFESKSVLEGTYICLDKDGLPIKTKDLKDKEIARVVVRNIKTFEIAIKNNQNDKTIQKQKG